MTSIVGGNVILNLLFFTIKPTYIVTSNLGEFRYVYLLHTSEYQLMTRLLNTTYKV